MKNIVLLGGSNSVLTNGLKKGLQQTHINLINFALGATSCIQNLYELRRRYELIRTADLIITESNVNDSFNMNNINNFRVLEWFYKELFLTKKKILVLILPFYEYNYKATNHIHRYFVSKYQFNFIDLHKYYDLYKLEKFSRLREENSSHQFDFILRELGRNIACNVHNFRFSEANLKLNNPEFLICKAGELSRENLRSIKNSIYEENYFRIEKDNFLTFPEKYYDYYIIAYHTWNNTDDTKIAAPWDWLERRAVKSTLTISDNREQVELEPCLDNIVYETKFVKINNNTKIRSSNSLKSTINFDHVDLVSFFLVERYESNELLKDRVESILETNIENNAHYCFDSLIPPIMLYKEIIDEYSCIMECRKNLTYNIKIQNLELKLQNKTNKLKSLQENIRYHQSAKQRIYNHLSYKLGFCAIKKSKTLLGWISMPIILLSIFISHKQEQKIYQEKIKKDPSLKLPPLELYADYQEAKKEENTLTYKLGQAIMNANKTWYKGG
ncbi:hypothetical protein XJ74_06340, partial [Campylobacter coli]|nr:hypothetical protein [Campylobacter coli]